MLKHIALIQNELSESKLPFTISSHHGKALTILWLLVKDKESFVRKCNIHFKKYFNIEYTNDDFQKLPNLLIVVQFVLYYQEVVMLIIKILITFAVVEETIEVDETSDKVIIRTDVEGHYKFTEKFSVSNDVFWNSLPFEASKSFCDKLTEFIRSLDKNSGGGTVSIGNFDVKVTFKNNAPLEKLCKQTIGIDCKNLNKYDKNNNQLRFSLDFVRVHNGIYQSIFGSHIKCCDMPVGLVEVYMVAMQNLIAMVQVFNKRNF